MTPGWDSDWWGRDPIEQAGEDPRLYVETDSGERGQAMKDEISFRIGALQFDAEQAFARLLEASPWLARQFLDECEAQMKPRLPSVHRQSA
jgi:hypothetical protein